jgi:hypothetical protein
MEVVNEFEKFFDVNRFRDEGVVTGSQSAFAILVARVA